MTINDVISDITKLTGLELSSIRPGAEITIEEIDAHQNKLVLRTTSNNLVSRSLNEYRIIWEELMTKPAVHVDEVLHGSGSSRNQPETIFANLPYIEWLKINNKKHISFVGSPTHPFGTIKQMSPMDTARIIALMRSGSVKTDYTAVTVTDDISGAVTRFSQICTGNVKTVSRGLYAFETYKGSYLFASANALSLRAGTYSIVYFPYSTPPETSVIIDGKKYGLIDADSMKILVRL